MKQKLLLKVMLLLCALVAGSSSVWADTEVLSWSRSTTTNNYTSGYTFVNVSASAKSGYYQDGSTGTTGIKLYSTSSPICSTTPTSVTFTALVGGGSANKTLEDPVYVCYVDDEGNVIDGTETEVTGKITTAAGDEYNISMPTASATDAYGVYIYHTKESGYNVRYYSFSLSYEAGGDDPTISANPTSLSGFTYVQGNGPSATKTVSVSGSNLTANISLSLGESSNYEMCLTSDGSYTNSLSLTPTEGTVSATNVYVRLKSGLTAGNKSGSITLTSSDASDATVSLSGSVTTLGVTYDSNGAGSGTAPTDGTAYAYNATVTVLGNTGSLTKEHYSFGGWNTQNDGEGTNYAANATFNITANTTLYAKWVINTNSVTLPANDEYGDYSMNKSNPVAYGTEVTLTYTPASGYENYVATWSVNGTPISGNKFNMPDAAVTVTVSLNEVFDMTLTNSDIVSAGDAATGYGTKTITDSNGKTWNAYAIKNYHSNNTSSYHYLQIRSYNNSTAYYIQVPEYGKKITKLEMTVSGASAPKGNGGNTATIFFSASNSTSATGTNVASGSGDSKVTIDCSSLDLNTGYITAGGAVRIWDVKVTYAPYDPATISLNAACTDGEKYYSTYSNSKAFVVPADLTVSCVGVTDNKLVVTSYSTGDIVKANTGVLVSSNTSGNHTITLSVAAGTEKDGNLLKPSGDGGITAAAMGTANPSCKYYRLTMHNGSQIGFWWGADNGEAFALGANKAYLAVPTGAGAPSLLWFDNGSTDIDEVRGQTEEVRGEYYNLSGQRVANPTKGLYIVNGRKVVIK